MLYILLFIILVVQLSLELRGSSALRRASGRLVITLFSVVAFARGDVGTDTAAYVRQATFLLEGFSGSGEPGFQSLVRLLGFLGLGPDLAVKSFSLVFFLIVAMFLRSASSLERIFIFAYFGPCYFLNYSMNAIPLGIASALSLFGLRAFYRGQGGAALVLFAAATLFHFSVVAALLIGAVVQFALERRVRLVIFVLAALSAGYSILPQLPWVASKIDAYAPGTFDGGSAGLSLVLRLLAFGAGLMRLRDVWSSGPLLIASSVVMALFFWAFAQTSYAGLRFLDLLLLVVPAMAVFSPTAVTGAGNRLTLALALSGAVGFAGFLRNCFLSQGIGESPFLPYTASGRWFP